MQYLILFVAFVSAGLTGTQKSFSQYEFTIQRGTNISHWLSQSDRRGEAREEWFTREDMNLIASLGYDHIRLPVDEEQLWDETGQRYPEAFELLHHAISWASQEGLKIVVDLHIVRSHHFNSESRPLFEDPGEQDKLEALWIELSSELKHYPNTLVAYELLNEAVAEDPDDWNQLIARLVKAIRKQEPERKIVIGSNRWQSVETFPELIIPENDPNLILSFHFYHPMVITHYKASWTPVGQYRGPVFYPGEVVPEKYRKKLTGDLKQRVDHWGGVYTIDSMRTEIAIPLKIAREHNLPLYCGEWGCLPTVPEDLRLRWYSDVRTVLEENGIAWAHWDYKGGFGIVDRKGKVNEKLTKVLLK